MSFFDLTQINKDLLNRTRAEGDEEETEEPKSGLAKVLKDLQEAGVEAGIIVVDTDEPDIEEPATFNGWSRTDKTGFEIAVNWVIEQPFAGSSEGKTTLIDAFLEDWAREWREREGLSTLQDPARVPTLEQLQEDPDFINGATWLPVTGGGQALPSLFTSEFTAGVTDIDEETGEETTGEETVPLIGVSDPLTGVQFFETTLADDPRVWGTRAASAFHDIIKTAPRSREAQEVINRSHATGFDNLDPFGAPDDIFLMNLFKNTPPESETVLPHFSLDDIAGLMAAPAPTGGGGGTARTIEFDEANLTEQASNVWADWYLSDAPAGKISDIVDRFMNDARSFWVGKGGKLDFGTFVRDELRKQSQYSTFFRHKAPDMSEEQHVAQFSQPIRQGSTLNPTAATAESIAAVQSGAGPQDQLARVQRTREAQVEGSFASRFAQTIAGLGAGGRA